ncbi:uncharacterized protein LOC127726768 [Mytilus californianus]|uniref:uncharacterized protein LOC127726768 n=1 Tax=Mytilus californianus TaxID=6549 RepID=UPI002245581E|nr:uncharacterized protein LOC127726768 [Mytilus californianus]
MVIQRGKTCSKGLTVWTSSMFIVGAIAGIGVLSLPKAVEDTGGNPLQSELWRSCLHQNLVTVTNSIFNFGTAVVFMVLAANNAVTLLSNYTQVSFCYWLLLLSVLLTPITCLGTPKNFWYIGIGATISTVVMVMYLPTALSGYQAYGRDVNVNILKSLSVGYIAHITELLITVHLLFGFVIFVNPICQQFEALVGVPEEFTWKRCIVRPSIVLAVLFVSESVPHFGTILSLVGGSATTLLAYVFPCVFYMKLCRDVNEDQKLDSRRVVNNDGTFTQKSIEQSPLLDHLTEEEERESAFECEIPEDTSRASSRTIINGPIVIPMWQKILNTKIVMIGILGGTAATVSAIIDITNPESLSVPCYVTLQGAGT